MYQKYFEICDKTVNGFMQDKESEVDTANFILSRLLVENTDMKMFLISTGKWAEYEAWIKRFKKKYSGIENYIKNNLSLEERVVKDDDNPD
jgi:hypothetical protein